MVLEDCDMLLGDSLDNVGTLNGHIYDLRLWSRALGATDVTTRLKVRKMDSPGIFCSIFFWICVPPETFLNASRNMFFYSCRLVSLCFSLVFPLGINSLMLSGLGCSLRAF